MDVSVIIAVGREDISRCVDSLLRQEGEVKYEVVAVGEPWMMPPHSNVKWLTIDGRNPALKRNIGAHAAKGKIVVFIDDDAYAPPDWLQKICAVFRDEPAYAGVGGPNLAPPDSDEEERLSDAILSSRIGSGSASYTAGGGEHDARIGEIHLVNFAVRKKFFDELGGFNEALGYGAEDSEFVHLASRLQKARFRYIPHIFVYHRRRRFGLEFLKQRFQLRKQNGRLLWVRPSMYMGNPLFCAALVSAFFSLPLFISAPWLMLFLFLSYLSVVSVLSMRINDVSRVRWVIATMLMHIVSIAGLFIGFLSVPNGKDYARLARRP